MNAIDIALRDAWFAMLERLEHDPDEVQRRAARAARVLQRPVSAWCIRIRAADLRISEWNLGNDLEAVTAGRDHPINLTQWDIADLTRPVRLEPRWPGEDWLVAARDLGIGPETMRNWIKAGVFQVERFDPRVFKEHPGQQIPMVQCLSLLDPCARQGRPPHPVWGSLWQTLAKDLPEEYEATLWRVRRPGAVNMGDRGWFFRCPGRYRQLPGGCAPPEGARVVEAAGRRFAHTQCARAGGVRVVLLPRPCFTLADWYGSPEWLPVIRPPWADIIGQPPACHDCWQVSRTKPLDGPNAAQGWNQFVSYLTGGYLCGSEVQRPLEEVPCVARPKLRGWVNKPEIRAGVERLLLEGRTRKQIAEELGITVGSAMHHALEVHKTYGVRRTRDLREKLAKRLKSGEQHAAAAPPHAQAG